ncbi:universal stress protein [soil metagenome]
MSNNPPPVVVGIDGSETSVSAALWAGAVADKLGAPLHLVHSAAAPHSFIADGAVIAIEAAAIDDRRAAGEKILTIAEQAVHKDHAHLQITTETVTEAADVALIKRSQTAQLIVLGCEDVSRTAALLLGSTSLTVTTRASCPVVAWRGIPEPDGRPVVVGVDGTDAGNSALAEAFAYADRFGAPVKAVHAWSANAGYDPAIIPYLIDWEAVESAERSALVAAVSPWVQRYPEVPIEYCLEEAKPSRALLHHLDDAQLVVVGNHRGSAAAAAILGSTSLNLLHHSPVPVLVCQAAEAS